MKRGAEEQKKKLASQLESVQENLVLWLNAITKMAGVLGPLAIEPGQIDNQLELVQVMVEELGTERSLNKRLNSCAPNSSDAFNNLKNLKKQWSKLKKQLADRTTKLQGAKNPSKDFKDALESVSAWTGQTEESLYSSSSLPDGEAGMEAELKLVASLETRQAQGCRRRT